MNATAALPNELTSTGHICRSVGCMPAKVTAAAEELEITPALVVDGRRYFSVENADRIARHLGQQQR